MTAVLRQHRAGRSPVLTELSLGRAAIDSLFNEVDDETAAATVDAAWWRDHAFDTAPIANGPRTASWASRWLGGRAMST